MSLAWSTAVRFLTVCSVLVALAAGAAWAHPGQSHPGQSEVISGEALFVVSGRGWGHGVGMSQYGAYGMANAGQTYEEILAYYYSGTELGQAQTKQVRVLLAEARPAVTISSPKPFTALDARGETYKLARRGDRPQIQARAVHEGRARKGRVAALDPAGEGHAARLRRRPVPRQLRAGRRRETSCGS